MTSGPCSPLGTACSAHFHAGLLGPLPLGLPQLAVAACLVPRPHSPGRRSRRSLCLPPLVSHSQSTSCPLSYPLAPADPPLILLLQLPPLKPLVKQKTIDQKKTEDQKHMAQKRFTKIPTCDRHNQKIINIWHRSRRMSDTALQIANQQNKISID
jgi:hypothetical protein